MRSDAALVLMSMGYDSERDFSAGADNAGNVTISWYAATPMPSEAEIDAAAPNAAQMLATRGAQKAKTAATFSIDNGAAISGDKTERIVRALVLLMLDEINTLRAAASLSPRTVPQLINAIKAQIAATPE
jgi:hypothetical protein